MQIDKETVEKIAHLARLELTEAEKAEIAASMGSIMDWMQQLNEVDTDGVEPLTHMSGELNNFRPDAAHHDLTRQQALWNAPNNTDQFFTVPKVIE